MDNGTTFVLCTACVFLSPAAIVGVVLRHREKMAALKASRKITPDLAEELQTLRSELSSLRETTTKFDMSFDAAVHRVEQRLSTLEDAPAAHTYSSQPAGQETLLGRR